MPVNDLHIAKKGQDDLAEIKQYITEELSNPSAAIATLKKITAFIRILHDYALAGEALLPSPMCKAISDLSELEIVSSSIASTARMYL